MQNPLQANFSELQVIFDNGMHGAMANAHLDMNLFLYDYKQINMEGGQSGTYLRLTRASSGPQVSVAKTYRDETKQK